jgi:hypothetical protein
MMSEITVDEEEDAAKSTLKFEGASTSEKS